MALLGQGAYGVPIDYSAVGDSAWRLAAANSGAAGTLAGTAVDITEKRQEYKEQIKTGKELAKAMKVLYPELATVIDPALSELENPELNLRQQAGLASNAGTLINAYMGKMRDDRNYNLDLAANNRAQKSHEVDMARINRAMEQEDKALADEASMTQMLARPLLEQAWRETGLAEKRGERPLIDSERLKLYFLKSPEEQARVAKAALAGLPKVAPLEFRDVTFERGGVPSKGTAIFDPSKPEKGFQLVPIQEAWGDGSGGEALPESHGITPTYEGETSVISAETEAAVKRSAARFMREGVDVNKVPLGMRNNNPTNIVFPSAEYAAKVGAIGASRNKDAGSSNPKGGSYNQLVFDNPITGMQAGVGLARRKYQSGMTTANALIAGENGWTPGNTEAAANIARTMGVSPDADLQLNDPARMKSFLKALVLQEHGDAARLYDDRVFNQAIAPASGPTIQPGASTARQPVAQTPAQARKEQLEIERLEGDIAKQGSDVAIAQRANAAAVEKGKQALASLIEIRNHPGRWAATGKTSYLPSIRGSNAYDFEQKLEKAKALAGTIGIEAMRGLGAMSEKEFEAAKSSIAQLEIGQKTETVEKELDSLIRLFESKIGEDVSAPSMSRAEELRRRKAAAEAAAAAAR